MDQQPVNVNSRPRERQGAFTGEMGRGTGFGTSRVAAPTRREPASPGTPASKRDTGFITATMDKVIGFAIFAIFFGIPLFFTGFTAQGVVFEKEIFFYFMLLLGLVMWAAKGVISGEMNIRRTPLDIPIIGFWLAMGITTIFSIDRWHSFWGAFGDPSRGFVNLTALVIAYYLILSNFNQKRLRLIMIAIMSSGFIVAIWTLLAILGIKFMPDSIARFAPLSLIGSITGLGAYFSALVPLIVIAILKVGELTNMGAIQKKVLTAALFLFLLIDFFLILAIYNFVPWLGLFIGIVLFLVFILAKIMRPEGSWAWLPMALFVAIMILRLIGAVDVARVNLPVEVSLNYKTSYDIAVGSLKNKFFLGSGPATYGYDFSLNRPKDFNNNNFYNLRFFQGTGLLSEVTPTTGILGTIFFLIVVLSFLGAAFYFLYRQKEKNKLYSLGIFSAAVILITTVLSVKIEGTILILSALFATLTMATVFLESDAKEDVLPLTLQASPKFALALAFVFMVVSAGVAFLFVYVGKIYAADVYAGAAGRVTTDKADDTIVNMSKAIRLYQGEGRYFTQLGQYYMVLANTEAVKDQKDRNIDRIQLFLNNSVAAASQGREMNKNDITSVEALAQIYENAGLYVKDSLNLSAETYKRGLELEPHNPVFYDKLGQIKVALASTEKDQKVREGLIKESKDMFEKSVDEKKNYDPSYYQLALVQEALGNQDEAIKNAEIAYQLSPRNANYLLTLGKLYQGKGGEEFLARAEAAYKALIALNDKDINGHFYLGLLYEKEKKKKEAVDEYQKVKDLLTGDANADTRKQLDKMISNTQAGIENTPESLGLVQPKPAETPTNATENPNTTNPTLENATQPETPTQPAQPAP